MNNTAKKISILVLMLALLLTLLASCGGPSNLEEAFKDETIKSKIAKLQTTSDSGASSKTYAKGNTLVYEYTYPANYDKVFSDKDKRNQAVKGIEKTILSKKATFKKIVKSLEDATQLKDISIKVVHKSNAGDVLYEKTF